MAGARIISYFAELFEKALFRDAARNVARDAGEDTAADAARGAERGAAAAWRGEGGLTLNAEQNSAADAFLAHAQDAERGITPDMRSMEDSTKGLDPEAQLQGLDKRLKTADSFKRKLATELRRNDTLTTEGALKDMKDSVRYTLEIPDRNYAEGVNRATAALQDMRYQAVKWKPTWDKPDDYKGINSFWRDPKTGQVFEVQYHTPASYTAKMETHTLLDVERLPDTPPAQQAELRAQQAAIFRNVPVPPGIDKIVRPPGT